MSDLIRYSVIPDKFPREIVLLRGSGCKWKKCSFCDYHTDASPDQEANYQLNREVLSHVTGVYHRLEAINSGSFPELDSRTMEELLRVCKEKDIREISFESHWMYRKKIPALRKFFSEHGILVFLKIGVESFDISYREDFMKKGMGNVSPEEIAEYFDSTCLLFGLHGQTVDSMRNDIETGLAHFSRICINIMVENTTSVKPDPAVIRAFLQELYPLYKENDRVDILIDNTDFGVGGTDNA